MQTSDDHQSGGALVTAFEPCAAFAPGTAGSPECSACGWLDHEHEPAGADVRQLPERRPRAMRAPKRLAS